MKVSHLLLSAATLSVLATEAVAAAVGLLLNGEVTADHLLLGLAASVFVASPVIVVVDHILDKRGQEKLEKVISQLGRHALEVADLYQNAPCGYHSLDKDGVFRRINETELKWLGYARDEIVDKLKIMDLVSPASLATCHATFSRFLETGVARDVALELVRKDGTTLPVLVSATAVYDADGGFVMSRSTVYDMSERDKAERERTVYARRLEELSRHMIVVQEEARRRLSADLHDRASPNLAAIDINLGIIAATSQEYLAPEIAARLEDSRALIADTTASISEICTDLRPPVLDHAGLVPAIESYSDQFARRTGIAVRLDCANHAGRLPPELETLLFRVVQEALTNCARHAHAASVDVALRSGPRRAVLTIADDGRGFQPPDERGPVPGMGIHGMRDLAEFAGGHFSIESAPGMGTRIRVEI